MAKAPTLAQITAALTKWHCRYQTYSGAATRGRPGGTAPNFLVNHHTGGGSASASYLYFLFVTGRPAEGIPGPLCNVATDSGGTVHIGATGRANHAGSGSATTRDHAAAENYPGYTSELKPGPDGVNGNAISLGNEWIYSGTRPPTAAQYRGAVLYNVAMVDLLGWTALSAIAHREWTRRKDDPFGVNMAQFRRDVRAVLAAGPKATVNYVATGKLTTPTPPTTDTPSKPPTQQEVDDMPWTEAQLRAMMQAENEEYAIRFWIDPSGTGTALRNLVQAEKLQLDRIENALAQHASNDLQPLALDAEGFSPESRELVNALHSSLSDLEARPAAAQLQQFLNADGTMDEVHVITDAPAPASGQESPKSAEPAPGTDQ
jgi:predicted outer membrane protein